MPTKTIRRSTEGISLVTAEFWLIAALALALCSPFIAYLVVRAGSFAYYRSRMDYLKSLGRLSREGKEHG